MGLHVILDGVHRRKWAIAHGTPVRLGVGVFVGVQLHGGPKSLGARIA